MSSFKTTKMVRFEHCDPAGLIFYPRYFQLSHQVIEDWFQQGLGFPHAELVMEQRIGIPTVLVEATFLAASRLEETLAYTLSVQEMGRSSLTLQIEARCQGEVRCQVKQKIVFAKLDSNPVKSIPIPDAVREAIRPFQLEASC